MLSAGIQAPVIPGHDTDGTLDVFEGDTSTLQCQAANNTESKPVTLTWYRIQPNMTAEINQQENVQPGGVIVLDHTFTRADQNVKLFCEAKPTDTQCDSLASVNVTLNVFCK